MRRAEFREWLRRRTFQGRRLTPNGINNRVGKLPRIERALRALGFDEPDLDTLHANGRWPELVAAIRRVAADWRSNEGAARLMAPQAADPSRQLGNLPNVARQYGHFADGRDPDYDADADELEAGEIDEQALEALKARFLDSFPDFETGGGFPGASTYHPEEDDYKRALVDRARSLLDKQPSLGDVDLGGAILDLLGGRDSNLLGNYRTVERLKTVREAHPGVPEAAAGRLARADDDPAEAAARFLEIMWPLWRQGNEDNLPYGDSRILATVIQALARPDLAISVIYQRYYNLGMALLGRPLFGNNVLTAAEYRSILDLAGELFTIMGDWGWHPRDLWDVQGFIWVTCKEKLDMDAASDADRIRRYALDKYITPARQRGDLLVTIQAGELHNALGMTAAHANVCQALRGRKFQEMAQVGVPAFAGPDNSSTTTFTYALTPGGAETAKANAETVNLILYGPPGTGKTYRTAAEAVKLCDGLANDDGLLADHRRDELMARYRTLLGEDRIGFVTFHQNFSYEDFVEGLRPTTLNEDGVEMTAGFRLEAEPGAFRKYAELAEALSVAEDSGGFALGGRKFFKMSLGEAANSADDYLFDEAIKGGFLHMGDESGLDWSESQFDTKMAMIDAYAQKHPERPLLSQLSGAIEFPFTLRHRVRKGDIIVVSKGNLAFRAIGEVTGDYENVAREDDYTIRRAVKWHWVNRDGLSYAIINNKRFSQRTVYELAQSELKVDAIQSLLDSSLDAARPGSGAKRSRNFVLIIDEINRANVSKVFGELITLIEADKRIGRPNELRVLLPYSKKKFGVPANLHLVGTMNTADRSIALLDTALRRRFVFREIAPEPERLAKDVEGIQLRRVLEVMNDRIEYFVDRDHRIGHAYFMGDGGKNRRAIDATMRDKIIPLLQEYFFEDWSRVAAVLGEPEGKGGGFLDCRKLKDPTDKEGEDRLSWSVRTEFASDAYDRLVGIAPPVPTEAE